MKEFRIKKKLRRKLKNDLRNLGLSRRTTRAGLMQLAVNPCIILYRLTNGEKEKSDEIFIEKNINPLKIKLKMKRKREESSDEHTKRRHWQNAKYDTSTNDSQENTDVLAEVNSHNSNNFSVHIENCYTINDLIEKEVRNETLIHRNNELLNNSQKIIENVISAKTKANNLCNTKSAIPIPYNADSTVHEKYNVLDAPTEIRSQDYSEHVNTSIRQIEEDVERWKIWLPPKNVTAMHPNASMPKNAQPFMRKVSLLNARMPNRDQFMQSSTIPYPASIIPNINQQQSFGNSANFTQVPHSRQPTPNICQQYTSYRPQPPPYSRMPNANQQQFLESASYPTQGQYMPFGNISNVGIQGLQDFVNMNTVSSHNANMCSRVHVNQRNANMPPTTNMTTSSHATLQKNIVNSTAIASAACAQKQTSQIKSIRTVQSPMTINLNIPCGSRQTVQNVTLSESFIENFKRINAAMGNVRHGSTNVNQYQASCSSQVSQASSEKTQLHILNPNEALCLSQQCNMHPVQNTLPVQNVRQISQQSLPVNRRNANMFLHPTTNTRLSHVESENTISSNTTTNIPHFTLFKNTFVCPNDVSINDTSHNVQQNVLNERAEIPESQNKNYMQKKASTNPQRNILLDGLAEKLPDRCNVLQNTSGTIPKTSMPQRMNRVLENIIFTLYSQKNNAASNLSKSTSTIAKFAQSQTNKITNSNFVILTDIQKIVLRNQIKLYFTMSDLLKYSLNKQEYEQLYYERTMLLCLYWNLNDYIIKIMEKLQAAEKSVEKDPQDTTSLNRSLQENTIQTTVDKVMKIQSNRDNENDSVSDRDLEKQSSERSIFPSISNNLRNIRKSTTVKNNLETSNEESLSMPKSAIIKEPLLQDTRVQEEDNSVSRKQFQKDLLIDVEKEPESTETSLSEQSKAPEENSIAEVSAKNTETKDNAEINESPKAASLYDKQLPELCSLLQNPLSALQDASIEETEDQSEIAKNNANKRSSNMETVSLREISNVTIINSSGGNDATTRTSCNTEDQNEKICNVSNEISSENLQDSMRNDVGENVKILNSTKIQVDPLNISYSSEPSLLNDIEKSISPIVFKCKSTQLPIAYDISEFCLNAQQKESSDERSNNYTDEMYESSEKLYIDENAEKEEQCDKVSSSKEDNLSTSQDSVPLFNVIGCDSTKATSSPAKNIAETDLSDIHQDFVNETSDIEVFDEKPPLEVEKTQDILLEFKDEKNMEESMIDTTKKYEDSKDENDEQSPSSVEECEEMTLQLEDSDTSSIEVKKMQDILLEFKDERNMKESMIDTTKKYEDSKDENDEQSPSRVEECEEMTLQLEDSNTLSIEGKKMQDILLEFKDERNMEESMIDTIKKYEDSKDENDEQSPSRVEEKCEEMTLQLEDSDISSIGESSMHSPHSICLKLSEEIEKEIDTHSGIKAINEQLKYVSEQKYGKSRTISRNSIQKDDLVDANVEKVFDKNVFPNTDIVECVSTTTDEGSEVTEFNPIIVKTESVSLSSFKMENKETFQSDSEFLNDGTFDVNDNLGISDEIDDEVNKPCLRCKRKSTVYCQGCLEAHYCSKRCSSLHWYAQHYKQCKGNNYPIICID
ncbi:PREDICTED: uncharacterized protein LOC105450013 isoform X2 [Wasmannia auropunctata]|uniref:uncharacterized protein LOC105450013 isoform X2 n=1 Tax=Wasmannia auropunctata TaxID=64793 RepID=UPI0005EE5846|nr:PREDICTED: uncharacterized protein LOC105450013 isoform X2 [Wasmannia auropunctata]